MYEHILAQALFELPVGDYAEIAEEWLTTTFSWLLGAISDGVGWIVEGAEWLLTAPPVLLTLALSAAIAAIATRSWKLPTFTAVTFYLVYAMGIYIEMMQTLALVAVATVLAVAIGIPFGVWAARNDRVSSTLKPILDFMQTMPSFIYLLLAVVFFGIGRVPGVMSALIFSMPPAVRLTELGIRQVDHEVVEAAEAFGARPREVLTGVQLPLARASIMAGVNQVIMLALSMVVIAGLGGAGGLGALVVRAVTSMNIGLGIEGGLGVVVLAIFLDRVTAAFGREDRSRDGDTQVDEQDTTQADDDSDVDEQAQPVAAT